MLSLFFYFRAKKNHFLLKSREMVQIEEEEKLEV